MKHFYPYKFCFRSFLSSVNKKIFVHWPIPLFALAMIVATASMGYAQTRVSGRVTADDDGSPIPGATVMLQGTSNGTITDVDGNYSINVDAANAVLVFSYVGYLTEEIPVNNRSVVDISLMTDIAELMEVVVVGYGTVKKSDLTGSVVSVRGEDLTAIPVTNALEVMQGKVPGLDLTRNSGQAGAKLDLNIRGNRSIQAGNSPLVLVDGIRYEGSLDVNPNDIASIEVLKDASATAIYGTLGANGVILITTKEGVKGKSKVTFNSYYGIQSSKGYADIMSGPEWVALRRESRRTVNEWNGPEDDANIFNPTQLENFRNGIWTDWADEIIGRGSQQNYQIGISGGAEKMTYYLSTEYFDEKGLLANDELKRYSGRMNIGYNILDNLKVSTNLMYTFKDWDVRRDPLNQANKMSPLGRPYDDDGNFLTFPVGDASTLNPLVDEQPGAYENNEINKRFFGNLSLEYKPITGLNITSRFGVDQHSNRNGLFAATNTIETGANGLSLAKAELVNFSRVTWENFADYSTTLSEGHELSALLGTSIWSQREEMFGALGRDLLSSTMLFYNLGATQSGYELESYLTEQSLASFFGRINYKLLNKYLLTLVMRADGSSVLADGKKWGYFPSASVAWILKEENFLRNSNAISEMKLRVSYGLSGNSSVKPYMTRGGLGKTTYAFDRDGSESPAFGFFPAALSNPELSWETTATANLGLDFGFFNNRLIGSVDIYQQDTRDLLLLRNLPTSTGFESVISNVGKTQNRGIELQLGSTNIDIPNGFRWTTDLSFAANKEEVVELGEGVERDLSFGDYGLHVGHPINVFYDYDKIGIWQLGEEDEASFNDQKPGDIKIRDVDGINGITPEDRVILGNSNPDFTLGFTNRFSYKGIELSAFIFARYGQMIESEAAGSYKIDGLENGPVVDYWTPENPTNAYPRPNAGTSRASTRYYSTLQYVDGSFLKIRDITLAYNFSPDFLDRLNISRLRVYATAKNYFVFSEIAPYDPERGGALSFPMTKQMVFGLNLEF